MSLLTNSQEKIIHNAEVTIPHETVLIKKNNPHYIMLIVLIMMSVLLVTISISFIILYTSTPLLLYSCIAMVLLCLCILAVSCICLRNVPKHISEDPVKPPVIPIPSISDDKIISVHAKPDLKAFQSDEISQDIQKNISAILKEIALENIGDITLINEHCCSFKHEKAPNRIYKLSYSCRNSQFIDSSTRVKNYYQAYLIAQNICHAYNLDLLKVPCINWYELNSITPHLVYDLTVEDKLPFTFDVPTQRDLYKGTSTDMKNLVRQLTCFICKTGCSSIDFNHIPINPQNHKETYLLDLDINLEVTTKRILDGLLGTRSKRGLINCLGSQDLIEVLLQEAKLNGININSDRVQQAVSSRIEDISILNNLELMHNAPPPMKKLPLLEDVALDDPIINECGLDISKDAYDCLSNNLKAILYGRALARTQGNIIIQESLELEYKKIIVENYGVTYCSFYKGGVSDDDVNKKVLNIYKTYILMHQTVKEKQLNYLKIPKVKLLKFTEPGLFGEDKNYYILAIEDILCFEDSTDYAQNHSLYNIRSPRNPIADQAIMQLAQLNAAIGLNLNDTNTFRLRSGDYQLVLKNLEQTSPDIGLFGDSKVSYSGILYLASSEKVINQLLLFNAQEGILQDDHDHIERIFEKLYKYLQLTEFYENYRIGNNSININSKDLEEYLNLNLEADVSDIDYFSNQNIRTISMGEVIDLFIKDLNLFLQGSLISSCPDYYNPESRRFVIINDFHEDYDKFFQPYYRIYFNELTKKERRKQSALSFLHLIKDALIAKGVAFPDFSGRLARLDKTSLVLHI